MSHACVVSRLVNRNLKPTRSPGHTAFTTVLVVCVAVAAAGQTPIISGPTIFLPQVTYVVATGTGGAGGQGAAAIADLNRDGKLDLVLINREANTIAVLLGNGDGTFQAPQNYSTGLDNDEVTVADLNGDGIPDLVVDGCGSTCNNGEVAVLLGNGDGTFKMPVLYGTGGWVGGPVVVADVNRDGKPDLVVVNGCTTTGCTAYGTLGVLLGKGNGTFEPVVTYSTGGFLSSAVAIADVNGDGNPDLLVANGCNPRNVCSAYDQSHQVGVLLGKGDGTFRPVAGHASGGYRAYSITAIDLNGDGNPDLVVGNQCSVANCDSSTDSNVGVLLGKGDGTFQAPASYDNGAWSAGPPSQLIVADVNGDGKPDLIMTSFCNENSPGCGNAFADLFALLGNGNGTFQPGAIAYLLGSYGGGETLLSADLNDDGRPDLVLVHGCNFLNCPMSDLEVGVMLNNGGAPDTKTSLTSSRNPIPLFTKVTYTAKVTGGSGGTIGGTVTFAEGSGPLATVTPSDGQAEYSTTYRKAGSHQITATYSGVFHSDEGSRSVTLTENSIDPTTTVLATSGSPTFVGQPVTFTATVTSKYGAIPNGELVKFYDGNTLLASVALSGGKATFTTSKLTAKTHGMRAVYEGDSMFATSIGFVTQVVERYATTTSLTCKPNPSSFGQAVTMTSTVKSAGPDTPTGNVVFRDGTTWIGAATLSGGVAQITKSNLAVGTHSITAAYGGDSMSAASTSPAVKQVVQ